MKLYSVLLLFLIGLAKFSFAQEKLITNAYNRKTVSLNGQWKYIVDPYENGFYNYRYEPFEDQENPGKAAFFTNSKRESKSELVEYNFDKMDSILVQVIGIHKKKSCIIMKVQFGIKNHLTIQNLKTPIVYLFILRLQTTKQMFI